MSNQQLVHDAIDQAYQILEAIYGYSLRRPTVKFTLRGRVAGQANPLTHALNFNMVLLNENTVTFIAQTVPHEVAHLVDHIVNDGVNTISRIGKRRRPHGCGWKSIMRLLSADPSRCHTYDTTNSRRCTSTNIQYICTGCQKVVQMGAIRHKRQQSGSKSYCHCRGHKLTLVT